MSSLLDGFYYSLVDTRNPLTDAEKQANVDSFYNYFEDYMTIAAMAGILGNIQHESYLNPGQGELGHEMSPTWGLGFIQWTPGSGLQNWSTERGLTWYSGQTQCYRIKCEGEGIESTSGDWHTTSDYPYSWAEFCALTDYAEATKAYLYERERAGTEALDTRLSYALNWYNYLSGKPGPTPPTPHDPIDTKLLIILASKQRRLKL